MWYRLDDVGDVVTGTTPSKSMAGYYGNDYHFFKPADLEQGINTITSSDALSAEGYNEARQIPCDSILVTCIGATIGKTGLIRREGSCNQQINAIIPNHVIVPEYLYYCCISDYFQNEIQHRASATTLPILNKSKFSEILIPVPPINEQRRIIERLSQYVDYISNIEEQDGAIKSYIQLGKNKILDLAIHGKLVPQDPSDEPAIELLKRINPNFKASDNLHYEGNLPNGWCFSTIGDLFQHNTGKALNRRDQVGEDLRYITTSNLYWDRFDLSEVRTMPFTDVEKEKCRATKGDLLVCEGGDIGRSAIWPYDYDVMIQNHIHRLRPRGEISVRFFYYVFFLYKQMGLIGGKGIAILGLSSRELDKMVVPVPPISEQHRIVTTIEDLFTQMDTLMNNLS